MGRREDHPNWPGLKNPEIAAKANALTKRGLGRKKIRSNNEAKIVRLALYRDRMMGATVDELAKSYNISNVMVWKYLRTVMTEDVVKKLEKQILDEIVPMAIGVYKKKLEAESEFVAKDVLQNFAKIADRNIKREELQKDRDREEDSLEFLMRIKGKVQRSSLPSSQETKALQEEVIDGEIISTDAGRIEAAVTEAIREDLQADGSGYEQNGAAQISGVGGSKGLVRKVQRAKNHGEFVSVREIIQEQLEKELEEKLNGKR